MMFPRVLSAVLVCVSMLGSVACLARRRLITRQGKNQPVVLLTADKQSLLNRIAVQYESIRSFNATTDMAPAVGSVNKGKITEYKDVRAFILFRKPSDIHLIGLYPVVRNKAFDMVSRGNEFRAYIPSQNRFLIGQGDITAPSTNKLENLRPNIFLEALLIRPLDPEKEAAVLEDFTDEDNAAYIVQFLHKDPLFLSRNAWFDRVSLRIVRQQSFDPSGSLVMDVRYSEWQSYDGVPFPKKIDIARPKDEYGMVITLVKASINETIGDDKFVLEQPEGTERRVLGIAPPAAPAKLATPLK